jgi:putative glutamine amidotransferase
MKDKLVIGIMPEIELYKNDDPYEDTYFIVNNYAKRVFASNAIPIGLLLNDGKLSLEQLSLCDAFIIPGGIKIDPSIYQLLEYAKDNNKPVLGVCMGMQAMSIYSVLNDKGVKPTIQDEYRVAYDEMKKNKPVLHRLDNNEKHFHIVTRDNIDFARHEVIVDNDSLLNQLYEGNKVNGVSLHGVVVQYVGSLLNVVGHTDDGIIEAVENNDLLWIGVQYHPEIDDNDILINNFIKEIERRKTYDRYQINKRK